MSLRNLVVATTAFGAAVVKAQRDPYGPWTSWSSIPPLSIQTLWIPDSEPLSLEAKLKSVHAVETPRETVEYYDVSCPTAASPENDACREAGIYPAEVYHTIGSIWGGTTTYAVDDSTTTWRCSPGNCTKTIVVGGSTRIESSTYDPCYVIAHHLPIVVTEGADLLPSQHYLDWYRDIVPSDVNKDHSRWLSSAGCQSSETTMFAGAVTTPGPKTISSDSLESSEAETKSRSSGGSADIAPTTSGGPAENSDDADSSSPKRASAGAMSLGLALVVSVVMVEGLDLIPKMS